MPKQSRLIGVFCGDAWHPAAMIRNGLSEFAPTHFTFDWRDSPEAWQSARFDEYEAIVLAKGNTVGPEDHRTWLSPALEDAFQSHVRQGRGLLCIHSGTCYRDVPKMRAIIGGAFIRHPPPCEVHLELVSGHSMTERLRDASVIDEHYEMILDDAQADVFMYTRSEHGIQPAGWVRRGSGRVCVITPGHTPECWASPLFRSLVGRGLDWTNFAI